MDSETVERRLAAILSADAVGYSRLMAEDEVATVRTLTACHDEMRRLVAQHRGRVVPEFHDRNGGSLGSRCVDEIGCFRLVYEPDPGTPAGSIKP